MGTREIGKKGQMPEYFHLLEESTFIDDVKLYFKSSTGIVMEDKEAQDIIDQLNSKNVFQLLGEYSDAINKRKKEGKDKLAEYHAEKRRQQAEAKREAKEKQAKEKAERLEKQKKKTINYMLMDGDVLIYTANRGVGIRTYLESNLGIVTSKASISRAVNSGAKIVNKYTIKWQVQ
jgi:ribosomal protein L12E/L44/L45/RPP1/RPP2